MKTWGRLRNSSFVAVLAVLCSVPASSGVAGANNSPKDIPVVSYSAVHVAAAVFSEPLRDLLKDKDRDPCRLNQRGCRVAVAEGGSAALYLLLAGVFCFGALIFGWQRQKPAHKPV